jgi:hypothetical protein
MLLTYFLFSYLKIMDDKIKSEKNDYVIKFSDKTVKHYFQLTIKYVVKLFVNKITNMSMENKTVENLVTDICLLLQCTSNNDSDDDEGISVELYHAMKIAQQNRRSNDGKKN